MDTADHSTKRVSEIAMKTVIWCFMAITALCWFPHLPMAARFMLPIVGVAFWFVTPFCCLFLWRPNRGLAIAGSFAFILWSLWAFYFHG
jgi:hypothetical protein